MSAQTPETQTRIAILRAKFAADPTSVTLEEQKEAIVLMRGDRKNAHAASAAGTRKKAIAAIPDADDMLNELGS